MIIRVNIRVNFEVNFQEYWWNYDVVKLWRNYDGIIVELL